MRRLSPPIVAVVYAALLWVILFSVLPALAAANLTITPITWNVVGLDSNDVTTGPDDVELDPDLLEPFDEGFGRRTVLAALFVGFIMLRRLPR